jgi:hypothetical protein
MFSSELKIGDSFAKIRQHKVNPLSRKMCSELSAPG